MTCVCEYAGTTPKSCSTVAFFGTHPSRFFFVFFFVLFISILHGCKYSTAIFHSIMILYHGYTITLCNYILLSYLYCLMFGSHLMLIDVIFFVLCFNIFRMILYCLLSMIQQLQ